MTGNDDQRYVQHRFVVTEVTSPRARGRPRAGRRRGSPDETPLRVRARATARSEVLGHLPNGTTVTVGEVRPDWLRLTAPIAGWVYAENVAMTCRTAG